MELDHPSDQSEAITRRLRCNQFLVDYSENSSIHGIKYVFSATRNWYTRFFWALALIFSLSFSGFFLFNAFIKWQFDPDVGARKEILNIRKIPFPAITICPQTKAKMEFLSFRNTYKSYWEHFKLYGVSEIDAARFESMLHVCDPELSFNLRLNGSKVFDGNNLVKTLKEISYSIDDSMLFCKFRNELRNCSSLFNEIVTDKGICFSFNLLDYFELFNENILHKDFDLYRHNKSSSWSLDDGYKNEELNAYPYPAISQHHDSLRIILKTTDIDMDYVCKGSHQGFKVFFHLPGEFISITGRHLFLPIKHDVTVSVTAQMTKISENLQGYKPSHRKCYLTNEKSLKFFKSYTKNKCNVECLANYTMKSCGCVKFSMPRENSSNICDYSQINCTVQAQRDMMLSLLMQNPGDLECDCLPSCTDITYAMETLQADYDFKRLFESYLYDLSDMPGVLMSRLTIYFQEPHFEATERYVLFTFSDYIASCGGVLGLFMGFSILSFIELLYFVIFWLTRPRCR